MQLFTHLACVLVGLDDKLKLVVLVVGIPPILGNARRGLLVDLGRPSADRPPFGSRTDVVAGDNVKVRDESLAKLVHLVQGVVAIMERGRQGGHVPDIIVVAAITGQRVVGHGSRVEQNLHVWDVC